MVVALVVLGLSRYARPVPYDDSTCQGVPANLTRRQNKLKLNFPSVGSILFPNVPLDVLGSVAPDLACSILNDEFQPMF